MSNNLTTLDDWQPVVTDSCVADIKAILQAARATAYRQVNKTMILAYWHIGRRIVIEEQQGKERAEYGKKIISNLAKSISSELGKGFGSAQLWNCRQFYTIFNDEKILYTLCRELSWSHIRLIMRIDDVEERKYYIENCRNGAWTVRALERNIKTKMYQRVISSQMLEHNVNPTNNTSVQQIKDPYILEFLDIRADSSEKELESKLISHLQQFLLELGKGFSFVARQMHISTESHDFYIDLVFYNYLLKCFVLVDLKIDELKHADIGQMDMYVRMFDDIKRGEDDNPTIGIIFCTDKDESLVKYSVLGESKQIFASRYKTVLPTEEELQEELDRNRRFYLNL